MYDFKSTNFPAEPGCYLMRNARGAVIYVGKAKKLRHRLSSYFQNRDMDWKTTALVADIADVDIILVNNEVESLVLENNLIKRYRPRYNRMLMRDDTGYKYIVLTDESVPRFVPFKKHWVNKDLGEANTDKRFGPYPSGLYRDKLLDYICDNFQLRTCNPIPKRICLRYHLGTCTGICEDHISLDDYLVTFQNAQAFLKHPNYDVIREMKRAMETCIDALDFERAQRIKLQHDALKAAMESQIVERDVHFNQDVLYFGSSSVLVMSIKNGAVLGLRQYPLDSDRDAGHKYTDFLKTRYAIDCPDEIISNEDIQNPEIVEYLRDMRSKKVRITRPQRGVKRHLLALCKKNYDYRNRQMHF